jgi:hypothetical protein
MKIPDWMKDANRIEKVVTNSAGFHDSPRYYQAGPEGVDSLISLRMFLSARESEIASRTRNFCRIHESDSYRGELSHISRSDWYRQKFDLNTSKGIAAAVAQLQEFYSRPIDMGEAA